jgi:hypothetical protein
MTRNLARLSLTLALGWGLSAPAAAQLLVDDFGSGFYGVRRSSGTVSALQTGTTILGGTRSTYLQIANNPLGQLGTVIVAGGHLIVNQDTEVTSRVELLYGQTASGLTPLDLDLTGYDRIRVYFRSNFQSLNFNILAFTSPVGYNQLGFNVAPAWGPFTQDFLFADFIDNGGNWADTDYLWLIFQTWGPGGGDFAIDAVEVRAGP